MYISCNHLELGTYYPLVCYLYRTEMEKVYPSRLVLKGLL